MKPYNYCKRHLNWVWVIAVILIIIFIPYRGNPTQEQLKVYIDANYTNSYSDSIREYSCWTPGEHILYLENTSNKPMTININSNANSPYTTRLFDAIYSDTIELQPKERGSMTFTFNPWGKGTQSNGKLFFHIKEVSPYSQQYKNTSYSFAAFLIILISWWVLRQKGRGFWWSLLFLTLIPLWIRNKKGQVI